MVNKDPSRESQLQEKISDLTVLLEAELLNLKSDHCSELNRIKNACVEGIELLNANFEKQWSNFNNLHLKRVLAVEEQVIYLKELHKSQRLMLEDYLVYIHELENRVKDSTSSSGKMT